MLKKCFLSLTMCFALIGGSSLPIYAQDEKQDPSEVVAQLPDGQILEKVKSTNSTETSTVEESAIAHKMTQAEKNQNAKENDSWGGAITIIAMCIVIAALIVLSLLFLAFGKIFSMQITKRKMKAHGVTKDDAEDHHEDIDSGEVIAAISMALSEYFNADHDYEDTILTIRRMKRAYSPWNSKIYSIREVPEHTHNPSLGIAKEKNIAK